MLVKCFPQSPFSQCIIFSDIIFGIQYLISFTFIIYLGTKWQYHQTWQAKALTAETFRGPFEWFSERRIFEGTAGESTNIYLFQILISQWRGWLSKKLFWGFFLAGISYVTPKNFNLGRPPFTFFAHNSKIFDKYQMPIFFIEYLGSLRPVRTWLMYIWSKLSKN